MFCLQNLGFPGAVSGKEAACQCRRHKRDRYDPWVGKIPWRREWQSTQVFGPGEYYGQKSLGGCSTCDHKELVGHYWSDLARTQAWRILWTEELGGLQSMGSQRVGHYWSDLACTHAAKLGLRPEKSIYIVSVGLKRSSKQAFGLIHFAYK